MPITDQEDAKGWKRPTTNAKPFHGVPPRKEEITRRTSTRLAESAGKNGPKLTETGTKTNSTKSPNSTINTKASANWAVDVQNHYDEQEDNVKLVEIRTTTSGSRAENATRLERLL
jgi:hypothetical protein